MKKWIATVCLAVLLTSQSAWADNQPLNQTDHKTPTPQSVDKDNNIGKKSYRSKKLRLHKSKRPETADAMGKHTNKHPKKRPHIESETHTHSAKPRRPID